jgi:hypothetical protein
VPTSPLAEDFVSFREARQTTGLRNLQWLFAEHQSSESVEIELSKDIDDLCFQQCSRIALDPWLQSMSHDVNQWATALNVQDESRRQQIESFLQVITEFRDIVNNTAQRLEPALLVNYYRNLCERFLVYYNNHELITPTRNAHAAGNQYSDNGQYSDKQRSEAWVVTVMAFAIQRILVLIDPLIGPTQNLTYDLTR